MANDFAINLLIKAKDFASEIVNKFSGAVAKTSDESEKLSAKLNETNQQLKRVDDELKDISAVNKKAESFSDLKQKSVDLSDKLEQSRLKTKALGQEFSTSEKSTKKLSTTFQDSKNKTEELSVKQQQLKKSIHDVSLELKNSKEKTKALNEVISATDKPVDELTNALKKSREQTNQLSTKQKELKQSAKELRTEFSQSKTNTQQLRSNLLKTSRSTERLNKSFNQSRSETKRLAVDQQNLKLSTQKLRLELKKNGVNTRTLNSDLKVLGQQYTLLKSKSDALNQSSISQAVNLKKTGSSTKKLGQDAQQSSAGVNNLKDNVKGLTVKLVALGATYLTLNTLKKAISSILSTGGKFETLGIQLNAVMGSIAGGKKATEWIKEFAKNTPFQLDGVSKAFIKLKAFGLDPMNGTMQALADQTAKVGGGQEKLEGIVLALGQAWSKQKFQAEEANQLIERGVPIWELMSKAIGKTTAEVQEMSTKGQLGRKEIKLLIDEIGRSSEGAAQSQMTAWTGFVSNATDLWEGFLNRIAESGTLDFFKQQLEDLIKTVEGMAESGELQQVAQQISDFFVATAETAKTAISFINEFSGAIKNLLIIMAGAKLAGFAARLTAVGTAASGAVAGGLGKATAASAGFLGSLGKISGVLKAGLYGILISEVLDVVSAYGKLKAAQAELASVEKDAADEQQFRIDKFKEMAAELDLNIEQYGKNEKAIIAAIEAKRKEIEVTGELTGELRDYDAEIADVIKNQFMLVDGFGLTFDEMEKVGKKTDDILTQFNQWSEGSNKGIESVSAGLNGLSDIQLEKFRLSLQKAFDTGINKTDELKQSLDQINAEKLERSFKKLGITSTAALQKTADEAKKSFQVIKKSGQATTAQLDQAFREYAQKAIDANNGVASEALKVEAANRRVIISTNESGKAFVQSYKSAQDEIIKTRQETDKLAQAQQQQARVQREQQQATNDEILKRKSAFEKGLDQPRDRINDRREAEKDLNNRFKKTDFSNLQTDQFSQLSAENKDKFQKLLGKSIRQGMGRLAEFQDPELFNKSIDFNLQQLLQKQQREQQSADEKQQSDNINAGIRSRQGETSRMIAALEDSDQKAEQRNRSLIESRLTSNSDLLASLESIAKVSA